MKKIDLIQGTPEWHEYRKSHIGGSDAPAIMGVSPWRTRYELWQQKIGSSKNDSQSEAMKRGNDLEPIVRGLFEGMSNYSFTPCVFENELYPWMSCSVDGYDDESDVLIEIKCPGAVDHEIAKRGEVPPKYYPQLQHTLAVTSRDMIIYISYYKEQLVTVYVYRDDDYIQKLIYEEEVFLRCVEDLVEPDIDSKHKKNTKPQYVVREDDEWRNLANKWNDVQAEKKTLLEIEESLRQEIFKNAAEVNSEGYGMKVLKVERKGNVDYSAIKELVGVDIENYRGPISSHWKIDFKVI